MLAAALRVSARIRRVASHGGSRGAFAIGLCMAAAPALAATFTVTRTDDGDPGSLRQVLLDANAAGADDASAPAPQGSGLVVPWSSVDAGASVLETGGLRLSATVGQPDVAVAGLQGGPYRLRSGYWLTPTAAGDVIFADGFDLANGAP